MTHSLTHLAVGFKRTEPDTPGRRSPYFKPFSATFRTPTDNLGLENGGPTGTPIEKYGYDATGNRTSVLSAGITTGYTYAADSHRLSQVSSVARTYDASGNTTKIGGNARQFVYDNSGRMTQVKAGSTVTQQYEYNAKGEQVRAYLDTSNAYFVYDEAGHLLGEYDAAGAPKQQTLWFGDLPVGVLQGAGANQKLQYIEPDHLGTPRVVIDGTRNVPIWKWDLTGEAFGNTPPNQDPDADGMAFLLNLRYPGQRYNSVTGLNYNYFRDYDPASGRYVQSDPIGLAGGISTYQYVDSRPLKFADYYGLAVYLCDRPVDISWIPISARPYIRHMWIKTSQYEAGMGGQCPVPGQGCADRPYSDTQTKSHEGQSGLPGSRCILLRNVDEDCVNRKISPGQPTGTWSMLNQCRSFAEGVIASCRYGPQDGPEMPNTLGSRGPLGSRFSPTP